MGLDLKMMFAMHDALRRDVDRLARVAERVDRADGDPARVLRAAVGWELFKRHLHVHHTAEDEALWPAVEQAVADRPAELALLAAMEAEHAVIDPLIAGVDAALADREHGPARLGGMVEALSGAVRTHLRHEERDTLPLIDATLPEPRWAAFGESHRARIGDGATRFMPWLLDDADPARVAAVLGALPQPLLAAYESEWRPAYESLPLWPGLNRPAA